MSAMMQCPKCKAELLDDSNYCDQCGEKLMFCPRCGDGEPRRGKRCTQCGSLLSESREQAARPASQSTQKPQDQDTQPGISEDRMYGLPKDAFFGGSGKAAQPQQGGTMRLGQQQGGTMRPGQQQGGTMRPGQPTPEPPFKLVMVDDPSKVAVLKNGAIIGRTNGDYVDVFGSCQYVSGTHAKVVQNSDGSWLLSDLGSTNGTKVGTFQFEPDKFYKLQRGMIIEIGLVKFRVE